MRWGLIRWVKKWFHLEHAERNHDVQQIEAILVRFSFRLVTFCGFASFCCWYVYKYKVQLM
jgi:hypothetical protein